MGPQGARGLGRSGRHPPGLSNHTPGFSEVSCVLPRLKSCPGQQEGVRPVSPGSGGQNWRTSPPLASGHLNEHSAPRGTGSPRSIFRRGSRNPDRVARQRREEKTDKTQKERKRGSLKRWRQAQDSTFRLKSVGAQQKEEEKGKGLGGPSSQHPTFKAHFQRTCTVLFKYRNSSTAWWTAAVVAARAQDTPPPRPRGLMQVRPDPGP